jgi:hypothetical protein
MNATETEKCRTTAKPTNSTDEENESERKSYNYIYIGEKQKLLIYQNTPIRAKWSKNGQGLSYTV